MKKLVLINLLAMTALEGPRNCLRIMPVQELTRNATYIARVRVTHTRKANFRGQYGQLATLRPIDVIEGDFTLKEVNVLAHSNVQCAEDNYTPGQEMLVFLIPEEGLFTTLNFQYGQFLIVGEVVKAWRDKSNKPVDKPYAEVRREIEAFLNVAPAPPAEQPKSPPPGSA
jgi:hypothetical protein